MSGVSSCTPAPLARALGMSDVDIQAVKTAALLHDIGKLGVPEHILAKPGPLTPDEFQKVRMHPQIGADIIGAVPFPYPVAPLVLAHHERWDGRGYPTGLKGEQIPLGARILCLVDYFDALTSDRPYHKPLSVEAAAAADSGRSRQGARSDGRRGVPPDPARPSHAGGTRRSTDRAASDACRCRPRARALRSPARPRAAAMSRQSGLRGHRRRASGDLRAL